MSVTVIFLTDKSFFQKNVVPDYILNLSRSLLVCFSRKGILFDEIPTPCNFQVSQKKTLHLQKRAFETPDFTEWPKKRWI